MLDLPVVHVWSEVTIQASVCACVQDADARRKLRPKPENHPKPRPKPETSSADVAQRGVASIGVRS
jgi:hypothetical protein